MTHHASPRHPHTHFLDIPADTAEDPTCPYAVLPLPYERTVSFGTGTANGPAAILNASHEVEDFDEILERPLDLQVQTLPIPNLDACDDTAAMDIIQSTATPILKSGRFLLSLGGEHTVTAPLVAAAKATTNKLSVLMFDAHLDLRESYEGTPLSHACVTRRIHEMGVPTIHVGTRSCSAAEYNYVKANTLPVFWARNIPAHTANWARQTLLESLTDNVYISLDIDALDPSLAPGTGTPEPGGLSWNQMTEILQTVIARRTVVAADIVETAPQSGSQVSEFTAARLGARILACHHYRDER